MFSIGDVLSSGLQTYKRHWIVVILALIVMTAINGAVSVFDAIVRVGLEMVLKSQALVIVWGLGMMVVSFVVSIFLTLGFVSLLLRAVRDEEPELGDLFGQGHRLLQGLIVQVILMIGMFLIMIPGVVVGVAAGFATKNPIVGLLLGTLLVVLPMVAMGILTFLTQYFVVDRELDALSAIRASFDATKGSILNFILYAIAVWLIVMGISTAAFLPVFAASAAVLSMPWPVLPGGLFLGLVAFFFMAPWLACSNTHVYERLAPLAEADGYGDDYGDEKYEKY